MAKQYGLIIPGKRIKEDFPKTVSQSISKASIFDESSSSDDEHRPQFKPRNVTAHGPSLMERRIARATQEKALKEDPTVFQYDELYDEMKNNREQEQQTSSKAPKKPKYIGKLMEFAERRKLENELRVERQVQKEREREGEEFKDKESFVTGNYRKKLEEMRKLQEQEKRDEYLEAVGDVTKQKDLDGFYRHLYEQKTGGKRDIEKPHLPTVTCTTDGEDVAYQPIKSGKVSAQRSYRKRDNTDDAAENETAATAGVADSKKVHLSNNIDADSDFSIDSSSDEEHDEIGDAKPGKYDAKKGDVMSKEAAGDVMVERNSQKIDLNLDAMKKEPMSDTTDEKNYNNSRPSVEANKTVDAKPKREKIDVWKKRTVGEVYEAAVQRYYERRAAVTA